MDADPARPPEEADPGPASATDPDNGRDALERVAEEFMDRRRRGEQPAPDEYDGRCPGRGDELRELLSVLLLIEGLRPEPDETAEQRGRADPCGPWRPPERLGDYRIFREVGRGGMGAVYEAEQESLGRRVALKVLAPWSTPAPHQVRRFHREARSAAQLHHPNIVPIFGVGEHDGVHFYAMQFIRGLGLDQVLAEVKYLRGQPAGADRDGSGADSATEVDRTPAAGATAETSSFQPAPDAPRGASSPSGPQAARPRTPEVPLPGYADSDSSSRYAIAVARIGISVAQALQYAHERGMLHRDIKPSNLLLDGQGGVWITDFGLVKAANEDDLTDTGDLVGTLRYMAPERFWGRCDVRSDVYALGLTLYEMLALRPAFGAQDRHRLIHQITQSDPPPLRKLVPEIPRDLETIIHTAIAKEPAERYAGAGLLADDLNRWLRHEPILARPSTFRERMVKWARRNPPLAALVGVSILATAAVLTTLAVGYANVVGSLRREQRVSYFQRIALAERAWTANDVGRAEDLLDGTPPEFRGWEWRHLKRLCHSDLLTIPAHAGLRPNAVAFSPDGIHLATAGARGGIDFRVAATGRLVHSLRGHEGGVHALAFNRGGDRLASAGSDGTVRIWDPASGKATLAMPPRHAGEALSAAFSPDGTRLASTSGDFWGADPDKPGELAIWDVATGRPIHRLVGHEGTVHRAVFSPDGSRLASAGADGTVRIWDAAAGTPIRVLKGHEGAAVGLAFSPDGARIASAGQDESIRTWDPETGAPLLVMREPDERFYSIAFSPDGTRIASAGRNWIVALWDASSGDKEATFRGHNREVLGVAFSPDGLRLASADYGGFVKVWDATRDQGSLILREHAGPVVAAAFSPDGRRLATASLAGGRGLRTWDAEQGLRSSPLEGADGAYASVAFSPDGSILAAGGADDGSVTFWNAATGQSIRNFAAHSGTVTSLAFSPDGSILVTGGGDRTISLWDPATGLRLSPPIEHDLPVRSAAFSPDGRLLAVGTGDVSSIKKPGVVAIRDATSGRLLRTLSGHDGGVSDITFSPDSSQLASASWDRTVAAWDPHTGRLIHTFGIRGLIVWAVAFSPDGSRLVAADNIGRIEFWDTESHLEVLTLRGHMDRIYDIAFSPDSSRLATVGRDATARLWDAAPLDRGVPSR